MYMKYLKATFLTLFTFFFLFSFTVLAQDDVNPEGLSGKGPAFACLDIAWCVNDGACSVKNVHRARLTTSDQTGTPNSEAYIAECFDNIEIDGNVQSVCTTGNSELDKELFCTPEERNNPACDRYQVLQDEIDYSLTKDHEGNSNDSYGWFWQENGQFVKKDPPQKLSTNGLGKMQPPVIEVQSSTPDKLMRRYVLFTTGESPGGANTGIGGQQQDILSFEKRSNSCVGETWDPEGRVFDALSLEPIPQASVSVKELKEGGNRLQPADFSAQLASQNNLTIINPYTTFNTGYFNFLLNPSQYYRLDASHAGYQLMAKADVSKIPANANKIYFNDKTGRPEFWYADSEAFYQGTTLLHRDIPLMPTDGVGKIYKIEELTYNQSQSTDGKSVIVEGRLSHPFASLLIETCSKSTGAEVCNNPVVYSSQNGGPDEFGRFKIQLDQTKLQAGQYYKPTYQNANLVTATITKANIIQQIYSWAKALIVGEVSAQENSNKVSGKPIYPIISYIEGFAYDTDGNLMPGAKVGLYVDMMSQPAYYTTANEKGYYKITSENIPNTDYVIKYTSADGQKTSTLTTSQFAKQNEEFTTVEEIDQFSQATQATDPRKNVTPSYVPNAKISAIPNEFPNSETVTPEAPPATETSQQGNNNIFLIGAIMLLLVATAGTLIGVYLYKKKIQDQQM